MRLISEFGLLSVKDRYLNHEDFGWLMLAALVLHLALIAVVAIWPEPPVTQIPVRSMNIKLGGDTAWAAPAGVQGAANVSSPVSAEAHVPSSPAGGKAKFVAPAVPAKKPDLPKQQAKKPITEIPLRKVPVMNQHEKRVVVNENKTPIQRPIPANVEPKVKLPPYLSLKETKTKADDSVKPKQKQAILPAPTQPASAETPGAGPLSVGAAPRQFVRVTGNNTAGGTAQAGNFAGGGSAVGISEKEAEEIRVRYEQTISTWLAAHKQYPAAARQLGQQGRPVVRVRIDRGGNVKFSSVDTPTGHQLIDEAALDMVRRANPFPVPPIGYPGGALLEFLIPISFDLN